MEFTNNNDYMSNVGRFVKLESNDEYVIATLQTSETYSETHCVETIFGKCILPTRVEVNPDVFYKYFIKLSDLKFALSGETLKLEAPHMYLSTPVPIDPASIQHKCKSTIPNLNCKQTFNSMMNSLSSWLVTNGLVQMESVYEKAAKSLADNINTFLKNQDSKIGYKNISVSFNDEKGNSEHLFRYNNSYCGAKSCLVEISLGENRHLVIQ
jgi:hypothetical protein